MNHTRTLILLCFALCLGLTLGGCVSPEEYATKRRQQLLTLYPPGKTTRTDVQKRWAVRREFSETRSASAGAVPRIPPLAREPWQVSNAPDRRCIDVSDTLDQTDGLEVCVTAGFIMTTATTWWTQSGSGTLIEPEFMRVEIVPPNNPDAANPAIASGFQCGRPWRGVADPGR